MRIGIVSDTHNQMTNVSRIVELSNEAACLEHRMQFCDGPLHLEWAGRRLVVVHDPRELTPGLLRGCDIALHGHDHRHTVEMRGQTLVINPGESAGHVKGCSTVGILDLMSLRTEILNF
ncbi:MAG: metallophosphoesterase family protein [Myxococcales bacterium]|nr:metallophosphoesterase family protein [Myxococcales bacterium]